MVGVVDFGFGDCGEQAKNRQYSDINQHVRLLYCVAMPGILGLSLIVFQCYCGMHNMN